MASSTAARRANTTPSRSRSGRRWRAWRRRHRRPRTADRRHRRDPAARFHRHGRARREDRGRRDPVGSPPYAVPTERENALNALAIDRAADLPIMLYNYPGRMGVTWARSSSTGSAGRATSAPSRKARATSTGCTCWRATTRISRCPAAWTTRRWNSSPGARAAGSAAGRTSCPKSISRSTGACAVEGDFDKGRRIMSAMMPLMRVLEQGGKFIQCVKHGCEMGQCAPVRRARRSGAQQGRQAAAGTGGARSETHRRRDRSRGRRAEP
jgi:hypothetical protein